MSHKLILIRHGKSVWNLKNIFTGWVDVELDVQGEQEARLAVDLIKNADIVPTYAFTSYLKRAQRTLEIILEGLYLFVAHLGLKPKPNKSGIITWKFPFND